MASEPPKKPISFRLSEPLMDVLMHRATELDVSAHEIAKRIVVDFLQDAERTRVLDELKMTRQGMEQDLARLRKDLARTLETVVLNTNPEIEPAQVRAWVNKHLSK
jgi:hypothetical protein